MDYSALLNLSTELGRRLMGSGAEITRVEDSIQRLMQAYGVSDGQVFAIPNCLIVGVTPPDGQPVTSICRIPAHGIDLDQLELCNALCRRLCRELPPLDQAQQLVREIDSVRPHYSAPVTMAGHFLVGAAFTPFFGGSFSDALCGGLCGLAIGLSSSALDRLSGPNVFFKTLLSSAVAAILAQLMSRIGLCGNTDAATIGALMLLVPGVALTTAMRDIVASDIVSGITRLAESVLTATAIAIGVGAVLAVYHLL